MSHESIMQVNIIASETHAARRISTKQQYPVRQVSHKEVVQGNDSRATLVSQISCIYTCPKASNVRQQ